MNKHLIHIVLNGIRTFITPVTIFLVSWFVVNQYSKELWGGFVREMLLVNLLAHVLQWGNKEHLVRFFSKDSLKISDSFYKNLATRLLILIPFVLFLFFISDTIYKGCLLSLWLLGLFFYQSSDSLVVYTKKFSLQVFAEILSLIIMIIYLFTRKNISLKELIFIFVVAVWIKVLIMGFKLFPRIRSFKVDFKELLITLPFFMIGLSGLLQSRIDQYIIALYSEKEVVGTYQIFLSAFILIQALSAIIIIPFNKYLYRININLFNQIHQKIVWLGIVSVIVCSVVFIFALKHFYLIEINKIYYLVGALFAFPAFIYVPIIYMFYRVEKEKEVMYVNYIGAFFNLVLTLVFVFYGNPFNAIIASAIAQWGMLGWYVFRKKKIIHEVEMSAV